MKVALAQDDEDRSEGPVFRFAVDLRALDHDAAVDNVDRIAVGADEGSVGACSGPAYGFHCFLQNDVDWRYDKIGRYCVLGQRRDRATLRAAPSRRLARVIHHSRPRQEVNLTDAALRWALQAHFLNARARARRMAI